MEFDKQTVIVTGAAGNLGRATAAAFAAAGARCVLLDNNEQGLRAAFGQDSADRISLVADLADQEALDRAVEKALATFGRVHVLCNLAGGFRMGHPVHDTPPDIWRLMIELNAGSLMRMSHAVVPHMIAAGVGKIVNVAAMGGLRGGANMGAYAAAKSAVMRLTESMAFELRDKNINVNCVLPSTIDTPANRADMPKADPKRWVDPRALADVIMFLASDRARAMHGAAVPVVGLS
jgi:NAD(P)-dependent dehydrogenase (short-subunit alcohol dehydrogenase family)